MAWGDLPRGQRIGVLIGVPVIIAAGIGYFVYQEIQALGHDPLLREHAAFVLPKQDRGIWSQIETKKQEIANEQKVIDRGPKAKADLAIIEAKNEELRTMLSSEKNKTKVRGVIQDMAEQISQAEGEAVGEIAFDSVKIVEGAGRGRSSPRGGRTTGGSNKVEEIVYQCEFRADMDGLIYYISRLEKSTQFMALASLKIKPGKPFVNDQAEVGYELHDVSMDIKTYVYPEGE